MGSNVELGIKAATPLVVDPKVDAYIQRPRTPNTQYSRITETQLRNMKVNHSPFFHHCPVDGPSGAGGGSAGSPLKKHFVAQTSKHVVRGPTGHSDFMWVDEQLSREPHAVHNTSRPGAFLPWGPNRVGERTMRHFSAEERTDFTPIDCYRRPPTNQPGPIIMKYGRPNNGYYSQRNPSTTTWFGANIKLNNTAILQNLRQRTLQEYEKERAERHQMLTQRVGQFPEYSEYVDRYELRNPVPTGLSD